MNAMNQAFDYPKLDKSPHVHKLVGIEVILRDMQHNPLLQSATDGKRSEQPAQPEPDTGDARTVPDVLLTLLLHLGAGDEGHHIRGGRVDVAEEEHVEHEDGFVEEEVADGDLRQVE